MESPAIDSPEPTGVAETTKMALAIMEQSHTLPDGPEKERVLNIAKARNSRCRVGGLSQVQS